MATYNHDAGIFGAGIGGIMGAIELARRGLSVGVLEWSPARGGMTEGGLGGAMDFYREPTRSGLTREWYERVTANWLAENSDWASRTNPDGTPYWDWNVADFLSKGRMYYTPGQARAATDAMLAGLPITIIRNIWISKAEEKSDGRTYVTLTNGDVHTAFNWQDASYERHLSKALGITSGYGRDAVSTYDEKHTAGSQNGLVTSRNNLDAKGNLYPRISQMPASVPFGSADQMPMGFVFRMTISKHPNRLPFPKPSKYRRKDFEWFIDRSQTMNNFQNISSYKRIGEYLYGTNGPSLHGLSWGYEQCKTREEALAFWEKHFYIQSGMYWTAQNDPACPAALRASVAEHGLPHDQNQAVGDYYGTPGWSSQLYTRESGHMINDDILTEKHVLSVTASMALPDPLMMHGYGMDSHMIREYPLPSGQSQYDGWIDVVGEGLYQVGLANVKTPRGQAKNLVLSWGFSQSRSVLTSSRIETGYQILGEMCGLVQAIAIERGISIADVDYSMVKPELTARGAYLTGLRTGGVDE
jgi:hypothetical protein